jgi:hypothetical protein
MATVNGTAVVDVVLNLSAGPTRAGATTTVASGRTSASTVTAGRTSVASVQGG